MLSRQGEYGIPDMHPFSPAYFTLMLPVRVRVSPNELEPRRGILHDAMLASYIEPRLYINSQSRPTALATSVGAGGVGGERIPHDGGKAGLGGAGRRGGGLGLWMYVCILMYVCMYVSIVGWMVQEDDRTTGRQDGKGVLTCTIYLDCQTSSGREDPEGRAWIMSVPYPVCISYVFETRLGDRYRGQGR